MALDIVERDIKIYATHDGNQTSKKVWVEETRMRPTKLQCL